MRHCPNPNCPDLALLGRAPDYRDEIARCGKCGTALVESVPEAAPEPTESPESPRFPMACVAVFRDPSEAHAARAALEAQGFSAFLEDEHTVAMNWWYSQAVRGVKLFVVDAPVAEAKEALARVDPSVFNDLPEMQLPPTPSEVCPECGSQDVQQPKLVKQLKALSLYLPVLILAVPFAAPFQSVSCRSCGHTWQPRQAA